ncbi:nitric oxide synthase-like isoform X1 [Haliotis cracherodii]|uniref:nitric oxide synthase-like isoform X1 n=1 Tax=Haliotis cracherodii TaxID=6455 RepID=UPI0039E8FB0D
MPGNTDPQPNTIRVKLIKQKHGGLGFLVKQRTSKPYVVVADLVSGGIAEESGLVQVGDVILRINDINLTEMSYESAVEILKAVPTDAPVVLLLRGPEGYSTHLETTFQENGMPKTIRVTKPVDNTFVGRIKRTFATTPSPLTSPVRSFRKLCNGDEASPKVGRKGSSKSKVEKEKGCSMEEGSLEEIDSKLRDAITQTATDQHVPNGEVPRSKTTPDRFDETILDTGAHGSPKIILSSPKFQTNGPDSVVKMNKMNSEGAVSEIKVRAISSPARKSIEIFQDNDEITVVVKGDVKIQSDNDNAPGNCVHNKTPQKSEQKSDKRKNSLTSPDKNGHTSEEEVVKKPERRKSATMTSPNMSRRNDRRASSATPSPKKYTKLKNLIDDKTTMDILHQKHIEPVPCTPERCMGSIMAEASKRPPGVPRPREELLLHAKDFIDQYYTSIKRSNTASHQKRWAEVVASVEKSGTYDLTFAELTFGAKTAWRNAPRCIGRIQWSKLQVFDARHITTARGMFEALCNHIKYGTNKGNIRSAITIFPHRTDGRHDFKVWNFQLIRYAGYRQADGSFIGDPANVEFTEVCEKLGWKGKGSNFDVLPLVLSAGGHDPEVFEIPPELILEVQMKHPKYPWFAELGLRWYGLPAVSAILFDCGGLEFTAAPFNGWYMGTEIGARDFCDVSRYNITEQVAVKMGLDVRKSSSLWRDRALVEVNVAVLHSFQSSGVTITDHHAASESFIKHLENEQRLRGGCPADWVWVVPPMSGSMTQVFHQEMLLYKLKPSYEYQEDPWKSHIWKKDRGDKAKSLDRPKRKFGFRELARAVKFSAKLMGKALARRVKCIILYATETGKSERFARTLCEIFKHGFDAKVLCMEEYDIIDLEHEALVLIVTSTFGNGDPPENGEAFAKSLFEMKHPEGSNNGDLKSSMYRMSSSSDKDIRPSNDNALNGDNDDDNLKMETGPLGNIRFSVFGLGSRAYPSFCAFGHYVDTVLRELGGEKIYDIGEGDELCGQEESFRNWAQGVFKAACDTFCLGDDINMSEVQGALSSADNTWTPGKFRITPMDHEKEQDICEALAKLHSKAVMPCKVIERTQLQTPESPRQTILVRLDTQGAIEMLYHPGDHIGIYPANSPELVEAILARLHNAPPPDQVVKTEILQEKATPLGSVKNWMKFEKMPQCSLRTAFMRYLDVTTPPSQALLKLLATQATRDEDKERLELLSSESHAYEDWKYDNMPTLVEVLDEFPSLKVPPSLLMTQLPLLQQRYYSISSSPYSYPGEVHATIAVVKYRTQGGAGPVHEGVCSCWLNRCDTGEVVPCVIRAAPNFRLPEDSTLPMVMVGPGTGIAPFRSFWQQRKVDRDMHPVPTHGEKRGWGGMYMYFGCRMSTEDNIYEQELKLLKEEGVMSNYYVALSREPGKSKVYVQDILHTNAKDVCHAIMKCGGHFYVCGDVSMADDVTRTLERILCEEGGLTPDTARAFVLKLRDANRFHEDIFGVSIQKSSEVTDRSRDPSKRALKYINSTDKPAKPDAVKEVATPIPASDRKALPGKPKVPTKNIFMKQRIEPEGGVDRPEVPTEH